MSAVEQIGDSRRHVKIRDTKSIKRDTNRHIRRKARQARDLEDAPRQGSYRGWVA